MTLNILYSEAGWVLDPQYYILAAKVSTQTPINILVSRKYFSVNWIYVAPDEISSPPTNYFYQYFSYLWYPLKSKMDNFVESFNYARPLAGTLSLIVLTLFL